MKTLEIQVSEDHFPQVLQALAVFPKKHVRISQKDGGSTQAELLRALQDIQANARAAGIDRMSGAEINAEIAAARLSL